MVTQIMRKTGQVLGAQIDVVTWMDALGVLLGCCMADKQTASCKIQVARGSEVHASSVVPNGNDRLPIITN